ncbi:MAG TPA: hypothetical protein VHB50_12885 [Bryobacteraceae bacterium]|nr:hypothetical protein [Bryobacteraceae bacterium]
MHLNVRIHHWVLWWFYVGVVCGAVALVNIFTRDLSRTQDKFILIIGVLHWALGGLVCYASEGIRIERPYQPEGHITPARREPEEWHPASDFVLPGNRKSLLPPRH